MSKVNAQKIQRVLDDKLEGYTTEDLKELSIAFDTLGRYMAFEAIEEFTGRADFKAKLEGATSKQLLKLSNLLGDICGQGRV